MMTHWNWWYVVLPMMVALSFTLGRCNTGRSGKTQRFDMVIPSAIWGLLNVALSGYLLFTESLSGLIELLGRNDPDAPIYAGIIFAFVALLFGVLQSVLLDVNGTVADGESQSQSQKAPQTSHREEAQAEVTEPVKVWPMAPSVLLKNQPKPQRYEPQWHEPKRYLLSRITVGDLLTTLRALVQQGGELDRVYTVSVKVQSEMVCTVTPEIREFEERRNA